MPYCTAAWISITQTKGTGVEFFPLFSHAIKNKTTPVPLASTFVQTQLRIKSVATLEKSKWNTRLSQPMGPQGLPSSQVGMC